MDLSNKSYEMLLNLLYDTLEDHEAWDAFYIALCAAIETKPLHVLAIDKSLGSLSYSGGANFPPQGDLEYIQKYHLIDPRMQAVLLLNPHEWFHCHEKLNEAFVATSEFYQDFLIPLGLRYLSACKVVDDDKATIMLACLRGPEQGPLPARAIKFLDRLMPHLSRAFRADVKNFIYSTQALVGHALVNRLRQPVILLTSTGEVVHTNEAAKALLSHTRLIAVRDGQLVLPKDCAQKFLQECALLEQQVRINSDIAASTTQFKTMHIKSSANERHEILYAFFSVLVPQRVMGTFGLRPLIMLFLYHPESSAAIEPTLLYAAFGLTPAECRVALLITEGQSVKQIADALGTQPDTVRKQLQSIYNKTSTHRQPELIRLLLQLPNSTLS